MTAGVAPSAAAAWVVCCEMERFRWGGDLRRAYIFAVLAERTAAARVQGWDDAAVRKGVTLAGGAARAGWLSRIPIGRFARTSGTARPRLASSELLTPGGVSLATRLTEPVALDVHDHPIVQAEALGVPLPAERIAALTSRIERNFAAFVVHVVPSASFAALARLDPGKLVVAPNGSDPQAVTPHPFPGTPAIGFVSAAAPSRGIELLIEAARLVHAERPDVRLLLWLVAIDRQAEAYVEGLRESTANDPWIEIGRADYARLGEELARATVLVVPPPPGDYIDVAIPVKLLDSMAAGRPVVVIPRLETRQIVERAHAGLVAPGDTAEDLAAPLAELLADSGLAARLGANGRRAVETEFDWRVVGARVADAVLARVS